MTTALPKGQTPRKLHTVRTRLEMLTRPAPLSVMPHGQMDGQVTLTRAHNPPVHFYRYLYNTIGERWFWYERRLIDDQGLRAILDDPAVSLHVLTIGGCPAGMGELCHRDGAVELAFFGLMPDAIGKGYGIGFLNMVLQLAWDKHPDKVWLHTNSLDHPKAVTIYQRAGFVPTEQSPLIIDDPRDIGLLPATLPLPAHARHLAGAE